MPRKISLDVVKKKVFLVHGDNVTLDETTFIRVSEKARFIHKKFGEWWIAPKLVMRGVKQPKKLTVNEVKRRVKEAHHGIISLDETTYSNVGAKATFIDVTYGKWEACPYNVFNGHGHPARSREKCAQTCLDRYGVPNVMMRPEVIKKSDKKRNEITHLTHWLTGDDIMCRASYEVAFVKWCNLNKIDFDWQLPFQMPNGKTYVVDAYIKSGMFMDVYVEIKGFWRDVEAKEKWEWFHDTHPRSKLWMKRDLLDHGILLR